MIKLNAMMGQLLSFLKTIGSVVIIVLVLKYTGLLSSVTHYSQSAVMATGILDASVKVTGTDSFPYSFAVRDLKGNTVNMESYKGKVLFLNLWATWCGPCRAEMPTIQKLYQSVDTTKVAFVILSIDRERDTPKVISYIRDKQYTFPVYQPVGNVPEVIKVPSIPTTFIVSKSGKIVSQEVGTTNFNTPKFKKFLGKLMAE